MPRAVLNFKPCIRRLPGNPLPGAEIVDRAVNIPEHSGKYCSPIGGHACRLVARGSASVEWNPTSAAISGNPFVILYPLGFVDYAPTARRLHVKEEASSVWFV